MFIPIYLIIGVIVGTITLLIALAHSDDDDKLLKVKQLTIWTGVFILATILWPLAILIGFSCLDS